jgi:hypothetical protein
MPGRYDRAMGVKTPASGRGRPHRQVDVVVLAAVLACALAAALWLTGREPVEGTLSPELGLGGLLASSAAGLVRATGRDGSGFELPFGRWFYLVVALTAGPCAALLVRPLEPFLPGQPKLVPASVADRLVLGFALGAAAWRYCMRPQIVIGSSVERNHGR